MIRFNRGFIFVLILSCALAFIYGGALFFYSFYTLLFIFLFTSIYMLMLKIYTKVEVIFREENLNVGDLAECTTIIRCDLNLPIAYLEIKSVVFENELATHKGQFVSITAEESKWIRSELIFYKRGIYSLGKITLNFKDIFRVARLTKYIDTKDYVKVYPTASRIGYLNAGGKDIYRNIVDINGNNEDQFTIKEVRKYRQGDSLKKIHWKLSARYGELYVKNFENISGAEMVLFVDMNKENNSYDTKGIFEEKVINIALSLVKAMRKNDIDTKLYINSKIPREYDVFSKEDYDLLVEHFILQESDSDIDFSQFIQENYHKINRVNKLLAVTTKLTEKIIRNIIGIKNSGYSIAIYYTVEDNEDLEMAEELKNYGIECYTGDLL